MGLRRPRRFLLILQNSAQTGPTWGGRLKYETRRIRCPPHRISRKSRDHQNLRRGSISEGLRILLGFLWIFRNSATTAPKWGGCVKYEIHRIRGQSRRISRKSRNSAENPMVFPSGLSRWVCVVYTEFSRCARIRRKRPLIGAGV